MNKLNFKQFFATLILFALSMQMVSFTVFGQSFKNYKSEDVAKEVQNGQMDEVRQSKIAPDLEESLNDVSNGLRADETQKVIIQLKPATNINNFAGDEVSQSVKEQMLANEV